MLTEYPLRAIYNSMQCNPFICPHDGSIYDRYITRSRYRADPDLAEAGIMVAPWTDIPSETWEQLMIDTLEPMDGVVYNTQGSQVMEYFYSAVSDISKLGIGYVLVFGYTALTFGAAFPCLPFNPGASDVKSRSIVTLACVVTLQMSLATTAGLCSLMGR